MASRSKLLVVLVGLFFGLVSAAAGPAAAEFQPVPASAVDCGLLRQGDQDLCLKTAQDFWTILRAEIDAGNAQDPLGVLAELDERSKLFMPDGRLFTGIQHFFLGLGGALFGRGDLPVAVVDEPRVLPLDGRTVLLATTYNYRFADDSRQSQLETALYRRDPSMANGWHEAYIHFGYKTALLGTY